jgi:hypothetical protein
MATLIIGSGNFRPQKGDLGFREALVEVDGVDVALGLGDVTADLFHHPIHILLESIL